MAGARVVTFEGAHWLEVPLAGEADGWIAAYRLTANKNGLPVAAELRVFPAHRGREGGGQWSGSAKHVPPRGIGSDAIAAARPVNTHFRENWALIDRHWRQTYGRPATTVRRRAEPTGVARHPGRPGHPDFVWARWSQRYVEACGLDSKPIQRLASEQIAAGRTERDLGDESRYISGVIKRCRETGFLTEPPRPGSAGGELTPKAKAALRKAARDESASKRRGRRRK